MRIFAPAKLNLALDILGKRQDGYHIMRMLMQSIDLYDQIDLDITGETVSFTCSLPELSDGCCNLAVKAAHLFLEKTGLSCGISIHLHKNIPFGAGMGGGSADAAAMLYGLNRLCRTDLSLEILQEWGLLLGADVPFCLQGGLALAEGIGESLTPLSLKLDFFFVVCMPPFYISTKEAFFAFDQSAETEHLEIDELIQKDQNGNWLYCPQKMRNVFEEVLAPEHKKTVDFIKEKFLADGAEAALMTGSGSAVFALFEKKETALLSFENRKAEGLKSFLCRPVCNGPLIQESQGGKQ